MPRAQARAVLRPHLLLRSSLELPNPKPAALIQLAPRTRTITSPTRSTARVPLAWYVNSVCSNCANGTSSAHVRAPLARLSPTLRRPTLMNKTGNLAVAAINSLSYCQCDAFDDYGTRLVQLTVRSTGLATEEWRFAWTWSFRKLAS